MAYRAKFHPFKNPTYSTNYTIIQTLSINKVFLQVPKIIMVIVTCIYIFGQHNVQAQAVERPYVRTNLTLRIVIRYPETGLTVSSW